MKTNGIARTVRWRIAGKAVVICHDECYRCGFWCSLNGKRMFLATPKPYGDRWYLYSIILAVALADDVRQFS